MLVFQFTHLLGWFTYKLCSETPTFHSSSYDSSGSRGSHIWFQTYFKRKAEAFDGNFIRHATRDCWNSVLMPFQHAHEDIKAAQPSGGQQVICGCLITASSSYLNLLRTNNGIQQQVSKQITHQQITAFWQQFKNALCPASLVFLKKRLKEKTADITVDFSSPFSTWRCFLSFYTST